LVETTTANIVEKREKSELSIGSHNELAELHTSGAGAIENLLIKYTKKNRLCPTSSLVLAFCQTDNTTQRR
jgi:hypothetical protein